MDFGKRNPNDGLQQAQGSGAAASANQVWAGPSSGSDAPPAFRSLGVADLPANVIKKYTGVGRASAGAITATGVKVGDKVIGVLGFVTATGALASIAPEASFESTVTVADQIQQSGTSLNANTYVFFVQPRS